MFKKKKLTKKAVLLPLLIGLNIFMFSKFSFAEGFITNNQKTLNVFLLAGQSNMQGHAQKVQLEKLLCSVDEFTIEAKQHFFCKF